ncbi:MAG: type II toxin-antitoxin system RelE/ParE family toxin [Burkholderiaceae bacterium]
MEVLWSASAEQDRTDIFDFISQDNPRAAVRMDALFAAGTRRLAAHPLIGAPGIVAGTRELIVHESYRMVCECTDEAVWTLALVHTARRWPPQSR